MKKHLLLLAVALLAAGPLLAQPLKVGILGGITTGNYSFKSFSVDGLRFSPSTNDGIGYQLGMALRLSIPKFLQIQPELLYAVQNFNYRVTSELSSDKVKMSYKQLQLPVMVGFNIRALRFFGGPLFTLTSSVDSNEDNPRFKMRYNDSDIAWQMGIGVDIRKFFLDARYTSYFRDTKNTVRISGVNHKFTVTRNDYWSFHAGFFF